MRSFRSAGMVFSFGAFLLFGAYTIAQNRNSNRLHDAKSEFLQRAAKQPVDWYPLGPEVFDKAKQSNKPILVEVGASWCPFCKAMDREGYGNPEISEFINQHFVAVRIDYDAQPDLAHKLELAQALANLPSGLPLTMFVTPNGKLYEGGGYFPAKRARYKPSFAEFLQQAASAFDAKRFRVEPWDINAELRVKR